MTTPVYICTGFLDSGKTTFIKDTLMKQEWIEEGPTLLLQCEEGEGRVLGKIIWMRTDCSSSI